jgi:hypothetical protein
MSPTDHSTTTKPLPTTDVTIVTVLKDGRHLYYSTLLRDGDDPTLIAFGHLEVRGFCHMGHVERFVIIAGGNVRNVEARQ